MLPVEITINKIIPVITCDDKYFSHLFSFETDLNYHDVLQL